MPVSGKKPNIDRIFHALGDPTRRAIVVRLCAGPLSVSLLAVPLSITPTAVIQHLQVLEDSGLVRTEKVGRVRTCHIAKRPAFRFSKNGFAITAPFGNAASIGLENCWKSPTTVTPAHDNPVWP